MTYVRTAHIVWFVDSKPPLLTLYRYLYMHVYSTPSAPRVLTLEVNIKLAPKYVPVWKHGNL